MAKNTTPEDTYTDAENEEGEGLTTLLDANLEDLAEEQTAPAEECEVECVRLKMGRSKKDGAPYAMYTMRVDSPDPSVVYKDFTHVVMLPTGEDDKRTKDSKLRRLKEFRQAFGLTISSPIDHNDAVGQKAWAILKIQTSQEYGEQNAIQQFSGAR